MTTIVQPAAFVVSNIHESACGVSESLNRMYRSGSSPSASADFASDIGLGGFEKSRLNASLELRACHMTFDQAIVMRSREYDPGISWSFCLGEEVEWSTQGPQGSVSYRLNEAEMLISGAGGFDSTGGYEAGKTYRGLCLSMDRSFVDRLQEAGGASLPGSTLFAGPVFRKEALSPSIRRIVSDMAGCAYTGDLKRLYLEGKAIELASVYIHETSMRAPVAFGWSRTEREALGRARDILDARLTDTPGIRELSRLVSLNEFKLKRGFKQLFGSSIHAYVIERRLEEAYRLLHTGRMNVTEAALSAGFGKPSHFAQKFREKYGEAPSSYLARQKALER